MLHDVLITVHAVSGIVALAAGCAALRWRRAFGLYYGSLITLVASLCAVVAVDWPELGTGIRVTFCALTGLGIYMTWRAERGRRLLAAAGTGPLPAGVVDHVGFTLIALADGFAIIAVISAGGPGWLAAAAGVTGVAAGSYAIRRVKGKLAPPADPRREASRTEASLT